MSQVLTDADINTLYELYKLPIGNTDVLASGYAYSHTIETFDRVGVRETLNAAINLINADISRVQRVQEILCKYREISLDRSTIDRGGLKYRPEDIIENIYQALYPYTGIAYMRREYSNELPLG